MKNGARRATMNDSSVAKLLAAVERIEKRQAAYEVVAHKILTCIEVQDEKLNLIVAEMTRDPGPSPTTAVLTEILGVMERQAELLEGMAEDDMTPIWNEDGSGDAPNSEAVR